MEEVLANNGINQQNSHILNSLIYGSMREYENIRTADIVAEELLD
jgi:hypothetical protein